MGKEQLKYLLKKLSALFYINAPYLSDVTGLSTTVTTMRHRYLVGWNDRIFHHNSFIRKLAKLQNKP